MKSLFLAAVLFTLTLNLGHAETGAKGNQVQTKDPVTLKDQR